MKLYFLCVILFFSNMSFADMRAKLEEVNVTKDEVVLEMNLTNESNSKFYIYGANICVPGLLDKNVFQISYVDKEQIKTLEFAGPLGEGSYKFVAISPSENRNCKIRLDFNYIFPNKSSIEYTVKYKVLNPDYKDIQEEIAIESNIIIFVK